MRAARQPSELGRQSRTTAAPPGKAPRLPDRRGVIPRPRAGRPAGTPAPRRGRPHELPPYLPSPDVVERVLDERPVLGFGRHGGLPRGAPVDRAVPALAPLPGLPAFAAVGRPVPARLAAPPRGLLPRPVLDRERRGRPAAPAQPAPAPRPSPARSPGRGPATRRPRPGTGSGSAPPPTCAPGSRTRAPGTRPSGRSGRWPRSAAETLAHSLAALISGRSVTASPRVGPPPWRLRAPRPASSAGCGRGRHPDNKGPARATNRASRQ